MILLVEDNEPQRNMLMGFFREIDRNAVIASTAQQAREIMEESDPDVIVMDWMLPDGSGTDLVRDFRLNGYSGWIIMLTAKADSQSIVTGLQIGADDYITKPFRVRELEARLGTADRRLAELRRTNRFLGTVRVGDLVIEREDHKAFAENGDLIPLTQLEYSVLHRLVMRYPEKTSRSELMGEVWGVRYVGSNSSLYATIHRLKSKLNDAGVKRTSIEAVYRKGYLLKVS